MSLLLAAPSHAYKLGGKCPTRPITYHASAPQYAGAIAAAVAAWNASGADVRFKATSRRRAKLKICYGDGPSGRALLGYVHAPP